MWKVLETAGEQCLLCSPMVSLLAAHWTATILSTVTNLAPSWVSLLGKRWTGETLMPFASLGFLHYSVSDSFIIFVPWLQEENITGMLRILVGFRFICFIHKV